MRMGVQTWMRPRETGKMVREQWFITCLVDLSTKLKRKKSRPFEKKPRPLLWLGKLYAPVPTMGKPTDTLTLLD